jgi:hypothetical protein
MFDALQAARTAATFASTTTEDLVSGPGAPLATGSERRTVLMMATPAIQITTDLGAEDDVLS